MINKIVNLSQSLRQEGLPVSIRSTQSAFEIYEDLVDENLLDKDLLDENLATLKMALRSVYVKDKYDLSKFNKVFEDLFIEKEEDSEKNNDNSQAKSKIFLQSLKSNQYLIKKNKKGNSYKRELANNKMLKELSGRPLLNRDDELEKEGELLNRDLTKLNKFDPRLLELCQRLGKKIANKRSRRNARSTSNKIDIRKTIRSNLKYGGVPFELVKSKPRPHKNEHVFLNDISGSCEWISSWFFMLMFSAQMAFKKSRTFEFDNKTIETTKLLSEEYLLDAFIKVRDKRLKNAMVHGTSNMYTAFNDFLSQINLNNKSYVILLSDCRDWAGPKVHGIPASVNLIEEIAKNSKKLVILNPENRNKWDVVDSCVSLYKDVGAQVFEVNTLNQLVNFVESM